MMCAMLEHKTHRSTDVDTASAEFIQQLKEGIRKLQNFQETNENELVLQAGNKTRMLHEISASEPAVDERGKQLKEIVDAECKRSFDQLENLKRDKLKDIQTRKDEIEAQLLLVSSFKAYVEELSDKGSACAISQSAKDLLARIEQLDMSQAEFSKGRLSPERVSFEPANIADIISGLMPLIGWIAVNGEWNQTYIMWSF